MYSEFDEIADQIAADIGPIDTIGVADALRIARSRMPDESMTVIDQVAVALWRSYQAEG
jgi:hypothetical protein